MTSEKKAYRKQMKQVRTRISDLLERKCQPCPHGSDMSSSRPHCQPCSVYREIQQLGQVLVPTKGVPVIPVYIDQPLKEETEVAKISVEQYKKYQSQGLKDKEIAERTGVTINTLYQFKSANGLTAKKKNVSEPVGTVDDTTKVDKVQLQETINKYYENHSEKAAELKASVQEPVKIAGIDHDESTHLKLELEIQKLKGDVYNQSQLRIKAEEQARLYTSDYRNLETDYLNSQSENKRLKEMLDKLKHTSQINVWLMEQHVGFVKQLDTVTEVGEFAWR